MDNAKTSDVTTKSTQADVLRFGRFQIDLQHRTLVHGTERIQIQRKPLAVLIYLIEQAPRMVPRDELLRRFWSDAVNDESLTRCISTIRTHLRDNNSQPEYVETHHAQGYRFIADVVRPDDNPSSKVPAVWPRRGYLFAALVVIAVAILATTSVFFDVETSQKLPSTINRLAVLPVHVEIPDVPWLEGALTDHVMNAVSKIEGITVVASNRASGDLEREEIVSRLKVEALLLTRLEELPNGSRLSARLVAAEHSELLWQSSFESTDAIVSSAQVERLAHQVALRLRPALQLRESDKQPDERAYALYLRGRYYWSQRSAVGLEAAIESFNRALEISPDYVDAMLGAAESWLLLPLYGAMPPLEAIPTARSLSLEVLKADPHNARARAVLGVIAMQFDWDWFTAESLLREAVALNPNDATVQQWLGELYCYQSYFDKCRRQLRVALELDPLSPVLNMQQGSPALYAGDFRAAITAYESAMNSSPQFALGQYVVGLAWAGLADWEKAIAAYQASLPDLGLPIVGGPMIYALARNGDIDAARALLDRLEMLALAEYVPPSKLAVAHLGVGDKERAVSYLQIAVERHDDRLVYFANDVHFRELMGDPELREIANKIGLRTHSEEI